MANPLPVAVMLSFLASAAAHNHSNSSGNNNETDGNMECAIFFLYNDLDIPIACISGALIIIGILFCFFGYRLFRGTLFIVGFLFALCLSYIICQEYAALGLGPVIGISVAIGLFCGLLTMLVIHCGLFLTGFSLGIFFALAILMAIEPFYHIDNKWIPFGILLGLGVILALLSLRFQKVLMIIGTSLYGGALFTGGIDYFLEEDVLRNYAWLRVNASSETQATCWFTWIVLGFWGLMFILGLLVQFLKTGRHFDHTAGDRISREKHSAQITNPDENKAVERYRNMNQNGDIVAKSWIDGGDGYYVSQTQV